MRRFVLRFRRKHEMLLRKFFMLNINEERGALGRDSNGKKFKRVGFCFLARYEFHG